MKKTLVSLLLVLCILSSVFGALAAQETSIAYIQKYGNLVLNLYGSDLLKDGYTYGDIVTVEMNGTAYDMPVGANYSDVDEGSMVCRIVIKPEENEDAVVLAVNMGNLAAAAGIAEKVTIEEEPGYRWDYLVEEPVAVRISMKQPAGYLNEFLLRHLVRTNAREDYAQLSDEQFANFRVVATSGMGKNLLYRSSSPVDPEIGRNQYADAALKAAGVRTVINLADSAQGMKAHEDFDQTAYASCDVICLNLGIDFKEPAFREGMAKGLRFMLSSEGPYLVHCIEGKDRTGFVTAVLECLMGAAADEVIADYMLTYVNYGGVEEGTPQYRELGQKNIVQMLEAAFETDSLAEADLAKEAEEYLKDGLQLTQAEIALLKEKLSAR